MNKEPYNTILSLAFDHRLKEALTQLDVYLSELNNWELKEKKERLDTTYRYMLKYMQEGLADQGRDKVYQELISDIVSLTDQAYLMHQEKTSFSLYSQQRRTSIQQEFSISGLAQALEDASDDFSISMLKPDDKCIDILKHREDLQKNLFLLVWCNSSWTENNRTEAQDFIHNENLKAQDKLLLVSAVFLSLTQCFDPIKIHFLMDTYTEKQPRLLQRALIGLVFIFHQYPRHLHIHTDIIERWQTLHDDQVLQGHLTAIYQEYLMCLETENVSRKLREDIMPDVFKQVKSKLNDIDWEQFSQWDKDMNGYNPEWEKLAGDKEFTSSMEQLSDMQKEGADIHMNMFAPLKVHPFFRDISNWFYPFDSEFSLLYKTHKANPKTFSALLEGGLLCDCDKYSLAFSMTSPISGQQIFSPQAFTEMPEEVEKQLKEIIQKDCFICREYLQDLYRFYKLFVHRQEFDDVFKQKIVLHHDPMLADFLNTEETLMKIAKFYLRHEHWDKTIETFKEIELQFPESRRQADFYQQKGFAYQKSKRFEEAIKAYETADALYPNNLWTVRNLAICHRQLGHYEEALEHYKAVERVKPDNKSTIFHIANCLSKLNQYDQALNYFFKLDFTEEGSIKASRGIAWCSFMLGKYEQANSYYSEILKHDPEAVDYLNAAHSAWVSGDLPKAVLYYQYCHALVSTHDKFLEYYNPDRSILHIKGITDEELSLMPDLLLQLSESKEDE